MSLCWRDPEKPCDLSKCCYDAGCRAVFEYWKFAHGKEWQQMIENALEKERLERMEKTALQYCLQSLPDLEGCL